MSTAEPPATAPLDEVALALSGGGYRAAAFHLGVLDLLDDIGLLPRVRVLSTVSGGTITGMAYAVGLAEGVPFGEVYRRLAGALERTSVVGRAMEIMAGEGPGAEPTLIRAAARVYASDDFVGERRLGMLLDADLPLRDLVFNATEFRGGLAFRFSRSGSRGAVIGNQRLRVDRVVARSIRLADILAASSCFPAAFEPIRFPGDFRWPEETTVEKVRKALGDGFQEDVPLMDGGIYDNQGIEGIALAYGRKGMAVGVVVTSDTAPRETPLLRRFTPREPGWWTVAGAARAGWAVFALSLASALVLGGDAVAAWSDRGFRWPDLLRYGFPLALSLVVAGGLAWVRARFARERRRIAEEARVDLWPSVRRLKVNELLDLLELRVRSVVALTSSVFMKRIRGLVYRRVYGDRDYRRRLVSNLIYDLDEPRHEVLERETWLVPSPALQETARRAERMRTTLWFTDPADLRTLVACGQATACFNLLRFLLEQRADALAERAPDETALFARLRGVWDRLQANPFALVDRHPPPAPASR